MKAQWRDSHGVVHALVVYTYDGVTWCNTFIAGKNYRLIDATPTCVACIGEAARYYASRGTRGGA